MVIGGNVRHKSNLNYHVKNTATEANIGLLKKLWRRHFAFRFGVGETSGSGGINLRLSPIVADIGHVNNLANLHRKVLPENAPDRRRHLRLENLNLMHKLMGVIL